MIEFACGFLTCYALGFFVLRIVAKESYQHGTIAGAFMFREGKIKIYGEPNKGVEINNG